MAEALFANQQNGIEPFFMADAAVLYCKSTLHQDPPVAHFVVEATDELNSCQAGLKFNHRNYDDSRQLNLIAQLLGAKEFQDELNGKKLRIIARHTDRGTRICVVVHPTKDLAVVLNGTAKIVSVKDAIAELLRNAK